MANEAKKQIKVGLLGCGRIAEFHLHALALEPNYKLVAVADILPDRSTAYSKKHLCNSYTSLKDMLAGEKLDLVVLTTPSGLHPDQAKSCADAGVACLSEKPFGVHYIKAKEVADYFFSKNVPLFVVKQNRYNPAVVKMKELIDSGRLGKIYMIQANVFWQRPQSYYSAEAWRGQRDLDGGAFMNQASHYVDLVQWFGGEIQTVKSELATFARKIECEDSGAALIRFKSGTIGTIAVTMLTYPENLEGSLTVLGEKGTFRISGKALNKLDVLRLEGGALSEKEIADMNYEPTTVYGNGHGVYYHELIKFLNEPGHPKAITGKEGLKSLKLICQIYGEKFE